MEQKIKITVDVALFSNIKSGEEKILLIKRKNEPFKGQWCLPGGFVDTNENLKAAALRELYEETGLKINDIHQFYAFGDPDRDPRGHTVSVAFFGRTDNQKKVKGSTDAASANWFPVNALPDTGFDHAQIIKMALEKSGIK